MRACLRGGWPARLVQLWACPASQAIRPARSPWAGTPGCPPSPGRSSGDPRTYAPLGILYADGKTSKAKSFAKKRAVNGEETMSIASCFNFHFLVTHLIYFPSTQFRLVFSRLENLTVVFWLFTWVADPDPVTSGPFLLDPDPKNFQRIRIPSWLC